MYNIFEQSKKVVDKLTKHNKKYWETQENIEWNRNAISPDMSEYDEEELYKLIQESDKERLFRFG